MPFLGRYAETGEIHTIEYVTLHRVTPNTARWFWLRRLFLAVSIVIMGFTALFGTLAIAVTVYRSLDKWTPDNERWIWIIPVVIVGASITLALWLKRLLVPQMLRVYGANKFDLVYLKRQKQNSADR